MEVQLQPSSQAEPELNSWDDFCRSVLNLIAEMSPCPEPTLFVAVGLRGLQRFGDGTLEDLRKLLGRCVQELRERGLVEIKEGQLLISPAGSAEDQDILKPMTEADDILELTTDDDILELRTDDDILELTTVAESAAD